MAKRLKTALAEKRRKESRPPPPKVEPPVVVNDNQLVADEISRLEATLIAGQDMEEQRSRKTLEALSKLSQKEYPVVDMVPVGKGMAAMAASIDHLQARQDDIHDRLIRAMEQQSMRTKARLTVTERNADGGIESAEIEVIE